MSGEVVTDSTQKEHIGAVAHTNNTGELTAMYYAMRRALTRTRNAGQEVIWSDSLCAINMSTGKWMPHACAQPRNDRAPPPSDSEVRCRALIGAEEM